MTKVLNETSGGVNLLEFGRRISEKRKKEGLDAAIIADFFVKIEPLHNVDFPLTDSEFTVLEAAKEAVEKVNAIRSARMCFYTVQLYIYSVSFLLL